MHERLHFDQGTYLLVEWYDEEHHSGRVRAVICDRRADLQYATHLAACMDVPLQPDSGAPVQQPPLPATAAQS